MRDCSLTTESRTEECGIVTQVAKRAPRVCGDDPRYEASGKGKAAVLPAYAGMIPSQERSRANAGRCSPRMRG